MRMLRLPAIVEKTGLSRWTINRKEEAGDFPKRVRLGPNSVAWLEDEVDAWLGERIAERDGAAA